MRFELFHSITDPGSARVRKFIMTAGLESQVTFRNIVTGEEAKADYESFQVKNAIPVLRENQMTLFVGEEAVLKRLKEFQLKP